MSLREGLHNPRTPLGDYGRVSPLGSPVPRVRWCRRNRRRWCWSSASLSAAHLSSLFRGSGASGSDRVPTALDTRRAGEAHPRLGSVAPAPMTFTAWSRGGEASPARPRGSHSPSSRSPTRLQGRIRRAAPLWAEEWEPAPRTARFAFRSSGRGAPAASGPHEPGRAVEVVIDELGRPVPPRAVVVAGTRVLPQPAEEMLLLRLVPTGAWSRTVQRLFETVGHGSDRMKAREPAAQILGGHRRAFRSVVHGLPSPPCEVRLDGLELLQRRP